MDIINIVFNTCKAVFSVPSSPLGQFWYGIASTDSRIWFIVGGALVVWFILQLVLPNKYTKNGFDPDFNRLVGSGVYLAIQALIFAILTTLFGLGVYCYVLPIFLHTAVFSSTGWILNATGFWPDKRY